MQRLRHRAEHKEGEEDGEAREAGAQDHVFHPTHNPVSSPSPPARRFHRSVAHPSSSSSSTTTTTSSSSYASALVQRLVGSIERADGRDVARERKREAACEREFIRNDIQHLGFQGVARTHMLFRDPSSSLVTGRWSLK